MKINSAKQSTHFKGIPILQTSLQKQVCKGLYRPIDAFVYFMEKADLNKPGMKSPSWNNTKYGLNILFEAEEILKNCFRKTSEKFIFVESPQEIEYHSVKALASYFEEADQIKIAELQSLRPHEVLEPVKGAGLIILYAVSKIAETLKKAQVCLSSRGKKETLDFYRASGMLEKENNAFILPANMFKSFQEKIEERFPILRFFEENIK